VLQCVAVCCSVLQCVAVYSQHYLITSPPFEESDLRLQGFLHNTVFYNRVNGVEI